MPNWIPITKDTLNEASIAALIDACDSAALGDGQENRSAGLIQGVINSVRTAVQGCPTRVIDADVTTIPASLRDLAVNLIIARLKGAISIELSPDERDTIAWCRRELKEIRDCSYPIETPDTAVAPEVQSGIAVQLIRPGRLPGGCSDSSRHPFSDI